MGVPWFIVMALTINGAPDHTGIDRLIAKHAYFSEAGCIADARGLASEMQARFPTIHGRYLCMFRNETKAQMAQHPTAAF